MLYILKKNLRIKNITNDLRLTDQVEQVPVSELEVAAISWCPDTDDVVDSL